MITDFVTHFANRKVEEFDLQTPIADPKRTAIALRVEYEEKPPITDKLNALLQDPYANQLEALVIGLWIDYITVDGDSSIIVNALVDAKDRLPNLKALFIGDITYEEQEISWIVQSNLSPILEAYPNLELLQVRGGENLQFTPVRHDNLKSLIVQTGGLPRLAIAQICALQLPNLEHLELWLGSDNYGGDSTVEDLQPILSATAFPNLTYLGLRNAEYADKIAFAVVDAPILQSIKVLDLSMGTLGREGAEALLNSPAIAQLDRLDVSDNYLPDEICDRLKNELNIEVNVEDQKEVAEYEGETYRYCSVAE